MLRGKWGRRVETATADSCKRKGSWVEILVERLGVFRGGDDLSGLMHIATAATGGRSQGNLAFFYVTLCARREPATLQADYGRGMNEGQVWIEAHGFHRI